jgi:hypothetical protein
MPFSPIRSSTTSSPRAGSRARRACATFLSVASELESRTLLSTLAVVNDHDGGPGSLAQEVSVAKSGDSIIFSPRLTGQTIDLTAPLSCSGSLTFDGSRSGGLKIVDSSGLAFEDTDGNLVIKDMSIVGSVRVGGGNLEVHKATISGGHAFQGGGIYIEDGNLEINHSLIMGNTAVQGGGIYAAGGNVEINHSIISNNTAMGLAGGTGGTGGDAMGGGLLFVGFNMEINHTAFLSNMTIGGRGRNGEASTSTTVAGQRGGDGGNDLGGGMYIASANVINLDQNQFGNNVGEGGAGGTGGAGATGLAGAAGLNGSNGTSGGSVAGAGANGTAGLNGGAGGIGGNGGDGDDGGEGGGVFIAAGTVHVNHEAFDLNVAQGGAGGAGGVGGVGGTGGNGGNGGHGGDGSTHPAISSVGGPGGNAGAE